MVLFRLSTIIIHWPENGFVKTETRSQETNVL